MLKFDDLDKDTIRVLEESGWKKGRKVDIRKDVEFSALSAGSGEYDRMEIFEPIAGENLFPLGMVYGQWFLYVGASKKIYMGDYTKLYLLGQNIEEFLTRLC